MEHDQLESFIQEHCPALCWETLSPTAQKEIELMILLFQGKVKNVQTEAEIHANRANVAEAEIETRNALVEELVVNMRIVHQMMVKLSERLTVRNPDRHEDLLSIDPSMGEAIREFGRLSLVTITERKMEDGFATIYEHIKQLNDDLLAALGISKERLQAELFGGKSPPAGYAAGNFSPFGGVQKVRKV